MKAIVGLGNKGEQYDDTRHNVGFLVLDNLAAETNCFITRPECSALIGKTVIGQQEVLLVKPQTYMNLSGKAVLQVCSKYRLNFTEDILVITDDIALPFGKFRLRRKGSAGGHNGLKSIISDMASQDFSRLKIGVAPEFKITNLSDFVLSKFKSNELVQLDQIFDRVCQAIKTWVRLGIERAMAEFN